MLSTDHHGPSAPTDFKVGFERGCLAQGREAGEKMCMVVGRDLGREGDGPSLKKQSVAQT